MIPNMNPRQMERMLKQMGIESKDLDALKVTIEFIDHELVIENPQVILTSSQGQKMYQVIGQEKIVEKINEDDVKLVMQQTECSRELAISTLKDTNGDIANAIMKIKKD